MANAFDENLIRRAEEESIQREIKYPSFSFVDDKPIYSTNYFEGIETQESIRGGNKKLYSEYNNLDYVGASFYILDLLYKDNNWCNLALNVTASNCVNSNPIFKLKSKGNKKTTLDKYQQLFSNPNPFTTGFELFYQTYISLEHYGNAYWQIIRKVNGDVHSIHFIPSHMIRVVPYFNKQTQMVDYVYGQVDKFSQYVERYFYSSEIIHFKRPNHLGKVYGLSKLVTLFRDFTFDTEAKNHINSWFQKAFSGGMIFKMENSTKEVVNRNRSELREKFEGSRNVGRNMILEGDMSVVYDGNKIRDIDFAKLKQISRDDIMTCLGVPLSIAGIRSDVGQANVEVIGAEEKAMLRNTIMTLQKIVFDTINLRFFRVMEQEENITITAGANSLYVQKNAESFVQTASKFGGATVNENREMLGLPSKDNEENFDTPLVATNNGIVKMDDLFTSFAMGGKQGNQTVKTPSVAVSTTSAEGIKTK